MISKISKAIENKLLKEGDNQIITKINGHEVTIRAHIQNGKFISTNLLVERATRQSNNQFEI